MPTSEGSSSSGSLALTSTMPARDVDPLLKDLNEKKQSFRRNVVSLAAELKEVRSRLASQEQSYAKETLTRQVWCLFGLHLNSLFVPLQRCYFLFLSSS